jgi:hypothetical protein
LFCDFPPFSAILRKRELCGKRASKVTAFLMKNIGGKRGFRSGRNPPSVLDQGTEKKLFGHSKKG